MDRAIKIDGTAPKWPSCFEAFAHSTAHPVRRLGFVDPAHRLDPLGIWVEILRNDENFKKWKWKPRLSRGPQPSLGPWSFAAEFPASTSVGGHRKFSLLVCMWQSSSVLCFFDHATFFQVYNAKKINLQSRREHSRQNQQVPLPGQLLPCRVAHTLH